MFPIPNFPQSKHFFLTLTAQFFHETLITTIKLFITFFMKFFSLLLVKFLLFLNFQLKFLT